MFRQSQVAYVHDDIDTVDRGQMLSEARQEETHRIVQKEDEQKQRLRRLQIEHASDYFEPAIWADNKYCPQEMSPPRKNSFDCQ